MRAWTMVMVACLALFAADATYGRGGGHSRAGRSGFYGGNFGGSVGGSTGSVHANGYNRSASGTASSTRRSTSSKRSTSNLDDDALGPSLTTTGSQASHSGIIAATNPTGSTATNKSNANCPPTTTTPTSTASSNANQTTSGNLQFVGGFPFWMGLAAAAGYADPNTAATRQYGALVANARQLIKAGVYPQAATLLQRVIAAAPGTRIAGVAQQLLTTIPTL